MAVHLSEQSRADYNDYLKRFHEDPHSISAEEAAQRYKELVSHAPPALAAEANQHILGLLPQNEREVLAENIHGSQQGFSLGNLLGKDSFLNTPLGRMVLSAAVAYLANRMLGQQSQSQASTRAPSGLGDLLGSFLGGGAPGNQAPAGGLGDILGALAGGQAQTGGQAPASGGLPSGLGDILGALAGGQAQTGGQAPAGGGLPSGLGDILGALAGGQAQTGGQAPASGLGDILGALLGGAPADAEAPATEPEQEQQPPIRTHRKQ